MRYYQCEKIALNFTIFFVIKSDRFNIKTDFLQHQLPMIIIQNALLDG